MKQNLFLLFIPICIFYNRTFAQEVNSSKYEFKVYYNAYVNTYRQSLENFDKNYSEITTDINSSNAGDFSFALIVKPKNSFFHEFELMPASFHKTKLIKESVNNNTARFVGKSISTFNSHARYQLFYGLIQKERFNLNLGLFSQAFVHYDDFTSYVSTEFPESFTSYGMILGFTPGIVIPFSKTLDLSIDFPVGIYGISNNRYKTENPVIPLENRIQKKLKSEFGNHGFQARVGLGIKF